MHDVDWTGICRLILGFKHRYGFICFWSRNLYHSVTWQEDNSVTWREDNSVTWRWWKDNSVTWRADNSVTRREDNSVTWQEDNSVTWRADNSVTWREDNSVTWREDNSVTWQEDNNVESTRQHATDEILWTYRVGVENTETGIPCIWNWKYTINYLLFRSVIPRNYSLFTLIREQYRALVQSVILNNTQKSWEDEKLTQGCMLTYSNVGIWTKDLLILNPTPFSKPSNRRT